MHILLFPSHCILCRSVPYQNFGIKKAKKLKRHRNLSQYIFCVPDKLHTVTQPEQRTKRDGQQRSGLGMYKGLISHKQKPKNGDLFHAKAEIILNLSFERKPLYRLYIRQSWIFRHFISFRMVQHIVVTISSLQQEARSPQTDV